MEYEIFKEKLLAELRDFYGQDADVRTVKIGRASCRERVY